jgi:hypothetical protein
MYRLAGNGDVVAIKTGRRPGARKEQIRTESAYFAAATFTLERVKVSIQRFRVAFS